MTRLPMPFVLVLPLTLLACGEEVVACDASLQASVRLSVVDLSGSSVGPTELTYSIDGGEEREVDCLNASCSEAVAGWEEVGEFLITATYEVETEDPCCWYSDRVSETVTVEQGECHVELQSVELVLDTEQMICADSGEECG